MTTPVRVTGYVGLLAVVFVIALLLGRAVGPDDLRPTPEKHPGEQSSPHEMGEM